MNNSEDFSRIYITERLEEQRSKLAQIRSSFLHLNQNIITFETAYSSSDLSTPILYSEQVFAKILDNIDGLNLLLREVNVSSNYKTLVLYDQIMSSGINKLTDALTEFLHLQDQRISGLHTSKLVDFQPNLQSEYSFIGKVYNAVDALSYDLMESCVGENWIKKNQYVPISLFGKNYSMLPLEYALVPKFVDGSLLPYKITGPGSLITIPYYDCFRARFWPSLAHEVGHIIMVLARAGYLEPQFFNDRIMAEKKRLNKMLLHDLIEREKAIADEIINWHLAEFVSDIISVYICGPASFFSASELLSLSLRTQKNFFDSILSSRHPPIEIRLDVMKSVLELLKMPYYFYNFNRIAEGTQRSLNNVTYTNKKKVRTSFEKRISDYDEEIKIFAQNLVFILKNSKFKPFNGERWEVIKNEINERGSLSNLSPIDLMNVAWAVRIEKDISDALQLDINQIYNKREHEEKFFETLVHHMYKYYELKLVKKRNPGI
jgi:hypothetical protein